MVQLMVPHNKFNWISTEKTIQQKMHVVVDLSNLIRFYVIFYFENAIQG